MAKRVLREADTRVSFAELLYDLVFVFAITQLSHGLLEQYSVVGAVETGLLFLAIWWIWIYSTWVFNQLDPDVLSVRAALFMLMLGGLFLSMALPQAFGDRGLVFGAVYAAMQIGRTLFVWVVVGSTPAFRRIYSQILIWFLASGVFWVWGGFASGDQRLMLWAVALGIEYAAPLAGYALPGMGRQATTSWSVNGGHIAERCGLFVIICLGETLLVSGATFAETHWDIAGLLAFLAAVSGAIGMWWVYFHIGHKRGLHQIEHSDDPGRLARLSFTYLHIPIVAGIILAAVGAERAIAHPLDAGTLAESASAVGGVVLFLLGNGLFKWVSGRYFPLSHMAGIALCGVAIGLGLVSNLVVLNLATSGILVVVAVWEHWSLIIKADQSTA